MTNTIKELEDKIQSLLNIDKYKMAGISKLLSEYNVYKLDDEKSNLNNVEKISLFLQSKRLEGLSESTLQGYELEIKKFTSEVKIDLDIITTNNIRTYLSNLKNIKQSTIGAKLSVLKTFFSWLQNEELIKTNPVKNIKYPKIGKRLPKALTIEELELMRECCKTIRQRALLEILYATGCRLSEISSLNISDIDFTNRKCKVIGKGNKEREVYFSFKSLYHLKKYIKIRRDKNEALLVSERYPHSRLSNRAIQREINEIANLASIKRSVSPHTLRHTFATLTLNNGADIVAIQHLLVHEDPATTQIYAQISSERKMDQYKRFLIQ